MRLPLALLALTLLAVPLLGTPASAEFKQLRDWFVACDNLRACMAFGFGTEADQGMHLRIARGPEAEAEPEITVAFTREDPVEVRLRLAFDDASLPGLPDSVPARPIGDDTLAATVRFNQSLLDGLRKAATITVEEIGARPGETAIAKISLTGAVAALLFMDEQQKRVGTVTALAARGDKPAAAVPAPPPMPVVRVAKPYAGGAALPKAPPAAVLAAARKVSAPDMDEGEKPEPIAARLSAGKTLWGIPIEVPAYNYRYALYIVENRKVRPAQLDDPKGERDAPNEVTLPSFDPKTNILTTNYRGRGMGDCGSITEWGWDGGKFREISTIVMVECRGVRSDRWPTSFRARVE
jgi:hypothetical protein